ncbi:transposase family protein [Streptomyces antimycoticus]|uniref:transposase family protein n=1 Tax=Streptomyces antimycoticus TaxID=68175 RepID=UPI00368DFBD4
MDRALKKATEQSGELALINGPLIPTQHRTGKADRRNYCGKHHHRGLHFLALTDERGRLIWISVARPGRTHDNTAAHHDHILAHLRAPGLGALADLGFRGLDNDVVDPVIVTGLHASRTIRGQGPGCPVGRARPTPTGRWPAAAARSPRLRRGDSAAHTIPDVPRSGIARTGYRLGPATA